MRRVSLLLGIAENDPEARSRVKAFQQGLRDLGWLEGRNIRIDYRFSDGDPNRIKEHVAELVRLAPDVIVGNSTPVIAALQQATSTIPIVFAVVNDPVGQGVTAQVGRPRFESAIDFSGRRRRFSIQESDDSRDAKRAVQRRTDRADCGVEG
jgi:putative ABC transport system substrate-binding protein